MKKIITSEEAIELLPEGDEIHTFYNKGMMIIGADWEREDVIEKLEAVDVIELTVECARSMKHRICAYNHGCLQDEILFIETDMEKLNAFDPLPDEAASQAAGVKSHSEKEIYDGCIRILRQMIRFFEEYLETMDIYQEDLAEEERFSVALSNFDIVQNLFLYGTTHSGGASTRQKCKELGLNDDDLVEFGFSGEE